MNHIAVDTAYRPGPASPIGEATVLETIRSYVGMGFHLVAIRDCAKKPMNNTWIADPPLTAQQAFEHVQAGGNLAVHIGRSRGFVAVLDADSDQAVENLQMLGVGVDVLTPRGAHAWIGDDASAKLSGDRKRYGQHYLAELGVHVLHGNQFALLPPSRVAG